MKPVLKLFTPEIAEELLTRGRPGNITVRRKIERYKDMMLSGKWKDGKGMPIIYKQGILLDGRHRLTAIVETGLSFNIPFDV